MFEEETNTQPDTILCVDDEYIILSGLKEQLRHHLENIRIEVAESGEEGIEIFKELLAEGREIPVVISDQLMPHMRGEDFLAEIHKLNPDTFSILLTGQATAEAVGQAVNKARLYRYIGKPWVEDDLVSTIQEALKAWHQNRIIKQKDRELRVTHESILRFVPEEFINMLSRKTVVDIEAGDHIEHEMHVLFADLRNYTNLIDKMGRKGTFQIMNEFVSHLDATIREYGGFINSLQGDAIVALFPIGNSDPIAAGIK